MFHKCIVKMMYNIENITSKFNSNRLISININLKVNEENKVIPPVKSCALRFCAFNACILCAFLTILQFSCVCSLSILPVISENHTLIIRRNMHEPKFGERLYPLQRIKKANEHAKFGFVSNESNQESHQGKSESERTRQSPLTNEKLQIFQEYKAAPQLTSRDEEFFAVKKSQLVNVSNVDRFGLSTEYFLFPSNPRYKPMVDVSEFKIRSSSTPILRMQHQNDSNYSTGKIFQNPSNQNLKNLIKYNIANRSGRLRKEPWVVPVLVLATLTMLMITLFEIFVLFKAWRTSPSRRHLFLGQMLLLGLFSCAGLAAIITAHPTLTTCRILRFGVGVGYAFIFASLLVKCVFLISLNGGVYLPAPYQGLLLMFAVLIQVAIGTQWLLTQPPEVCSLHVPTLPYVAEFVTESSTSINMTSMTTSSNMNLSKSHSNLQQGQLSNSTNITITIVLLCKSQFLQLLFSLSYIFCLIIFVAVLAAKSRGIRDNYRESIYIGIAIGSSIPIWIGWMFCGLAMSERHKDSCMAFGLLATSVSVFFVMFMPKSRQLSAMGKEGLYVEDRVGQFSSLGCSGSRYSPSFFHFKPVKYGMMNGVCSGGTSDGALNNGNYGETLNGVCNKHVNSQTCNGNEGICVHQNEKNVYTTLEPTLSSNPNVYFHRGDVLHSELMY